MGFIGLNVLRRTVGCEGTRYLLDVMILKPPEDPARKAQKRIPERLLLPHGGKLNMESCHISKGVP